MQKKILSVVAIAVPLSLMGFGCNPFQKAQDELTKKAAESVTESVLSKATGGKVDVNSDDGSMQFKDNKTGDTFGFGENIKIPSDFPSDVYLYDGAKPASVITSRKDNTANITLTTADDSEKVTQWYEAKYKAEGWTEESSSAINNLEYREYTKDNKKVALSIWPNSSDEKPGTMITLGYSQTDEDTSTTADGGE